MHASKRQRRNKMSSCKLPNSWNKAKIRSWAGSRSQCSNENSAIRGCRWPPLPNCRINSGSTICAWAISTTLGKASNTWQQWPPCTLICRPKCRLESIRSGRSRFFVRRKFTTASTSTTATAASFRSRRAVYTAKKPRHAKRDGVCWIN